MHIAQSWRYTNRQTDCLYTKVVPVPVPVPLSVPVLFGSNSTVIFGSSVLFGSFLIE